MLRYYSTDIVNVKMIITEEKILSNIDKVLKLINPNSKKQIVQLSQDKYFKDLLKSIKSYVDEYPNKEKFPQQVYLELHKLIQYATKQFELNTRKIESLIRQREENIILAGIIKEVANLASTKNPEWKEKIKLSKLPIPEDVIENLKIMAKSKEQSTQSYKIALDNVKVKVANLEQNFHIEIDMERVEDNSKALSLIAAELNSGYKKIPLNANVVRPQNVVQQAPKPVEQNVQPHIKQNTMQRVGVGNQIVAASMNIQQQQIQQQVAVNNYVNPSMNNKVNKKPSLWQKLKSSKIGKVFKFLMGIKLVIEVPKALPEGRG